MEKVQEGGEHAEGKDVGLQEERASSVISEDVKPTTDILYSTPKKHVQINEGSLTTVHISSFFIGISFRKDLPRGDLTYPVTV